jgi:glycine oxidase
MASPDICIVGAGIIGLSLALELHSRGAEVVVLEQGMPLAEASTAAAGMLAASDPENPPQIRALSELSRNLYPEFLNRLFDLSGIAVPFQTSTALQEVLSSHLESARHLTVLAPETLSLMLPQLNAKDRQFILLEENSLDPRELALALAASVKTAGIDLRSGQPVRGIHQNSSGVGVHTASGKLHCARVVDCTGAWGVTEHSEHRVRPLPRKGQMLSVCLPASLPLQVVVRTPDIYIVPRTTGAAAGRAIIGATVEDAGFDKIVHPNDVAHLKAEAAKLLPQIADAIEIESWAGLRPGSTDGLPLLGPVEKNIFVAAGHYRNGILLAPATARVMAQLLMEERPQIDLSAFNPCRIA